MSKTAATSDLLQPKFAVVGAKEREKNHTVLQPIMTDLIAYGANVKQLHWNIFGPHFRSIHLQLDEIYADTLEAIDTVAERITQMGHSPNGTVAFVGENTEIKDVPEGFIKDTEVLLLAGQRTHELIGLIRSRMAEIEDVDTVTADILHAIVEKFEKHHWMIQAQRA